MKTGIAGHDIRNYGLISRFSQVLVQHLDICGGTVRVIRASSIQRSIKPNRQKHVIAGSMDRKLTELQDITCPVFELEILSTPSSRTRELEKLVSNKGNNHEKI